MLGKLSVALLIVASPALAQDTAPVNSGESAGAETPAPVAYKTKRICRSVEVVGSSIPRTTCKTKKIPIKPVEDESNADSGAQTAPQTDSQQQADF
jgi:hypothetical protein